jgi:hypothetical protein
MLQPVSPPRLCAVMAAAALGISLPACSDIPRLASTPPPTVTPAATASTTGTSTATATFSATPPPTVTITPPPTLTPTASYLDWPVIHSEDFEFDQGGWLTGKGTDELTTTDLSITGGKYLLKITARQPVFWRNQLFLRIPADFFLSIEVRMIKASAQARYGLLFRDSPESDFFFFINAGIKQYGLLKRSGNDWEKIIPAAGCRWIDPAGANRLAVLAQGSEYTLFINGEMVDSFGEDGLNSGGVAVSVILYHAGEYMALEFDNFFVTAP